MGPGVRTRVQNVKPKMAGLSWGQIACKLFTTLISTGSLEQQHIVNLKYGKTTYCEFDLSCFTFDVFATACLFTPSSCLMKTSYSIFS
jgi:hypothetical protein